MQIFQDKPMLMLATSPGPGGAATVLAAAQSSASFFAADVKSTLSIPNFYDNFDLESGQLTDQTLLKKLQSIIVNFSE